MGNHHRQLLSRDAVSTDGSRLGHVADVYVDARTGAPKWLVLTGSPLSGAVAFVPAAGTRDDDNGRLVVAYTRRQVRRAPHPPADGDLTVDEEAELAAHYGDPPPVDPAAGASWLADPTPASEDSLVRSEEELAVGTAVRPMQRARLVKRVVTEDVTFTVPLRREVLRLEYEEIADEEVELVAELGGREPFTPLPDHEVVLYAEIVEYEKRVVPKERVRLQQEVRPELIDLRTGVRKEEVDVTEVPATGR